MRFEYWMTSIVRFFGLSSFIGIGQEPLQEVQGPASISVGNVVSDNVQTPPIFEPPGAPENPDHRISCTYDMNNWVYPDSSKQRGVWLRHRTNGREFNISTDYEKLWPKGITRKYHVFVNNDTKANWDGIEFPGAKLLNGTFPGPWIQACWGDEVEITVTNNLTYNGTAIHMHGIRMLNRSLMDGVPGVTQCPIAPGKSFTYKFNATQYGTTWYHSHYSLQYSDGVLGPLTIHGPTSDNWDHSIDPILLGDHNHRSAFQDYYQEQFAGIKGSAVKTPPKMTSILVNGRGSYAGIVPERYKATVKGGKRYLLRLINTSTDTTFIFAIDNHNFTVVEADLVPVKPCITDHLAIGIGQRYHVVLNTWPDSQRNKTDEFWIRTVPADHCHNFRDTLDVRQAILYYEGHKNKWPQTNEGPYNYACRDEPFRRLQPVLNWKVPPLTDEDMKDFVIPNSTIMLANWSLPPSPKGSDVVNNWNARKHPIWVNYAEPTVKDLDGPFGPNAVVYPVSVKTSAHENWNYMVIIGNQTTNPGPSKGGKLIPAAHPIHMHGHDFALLQQSDEPYVNQSSLDLTYNNPPRRDVVLLPKNGFIVIAFRADNPGAWAVHCHIAWHASAGLAFQILEDKDKFKTLMESQKDDVKQLNEGCKDWDTWFKNPKNHWYPGGRFQDDSGI